MTTKLTADQIATAANVALYRHESSDPKTEAQTNLQGRTYYVSDSTLKYHHSRINSAKPICDGLFFQIVESCALDPNNNARGFRVVTFDLWGKTVHHPNLDQCTKTAAAAVRQYEAADHLSAADYYRDELTTRAARIQREAARMIEAAKNLETTA